MFTLGCEVGYGVSDWGVKELGSRRVGATPLECEWQSFKDSYYTLPHRGDQVAYAYSSLVKSLKVK